MLISSPESETASIGVTPELSASLTRLQFCGAVPPNRRNYKRCRPVVGDERHRVDRKAQDVPTN